MFLAGDEFGNTQFGNNNCYCQDNEISWLDWSLLDKNRELFEFFKHMIAYRMEHKIIREKLPNAVCGMDGLHTHDVNADKMTIERDARTLAVSFAGYDKDKGKDDIVYLVVNSFWEPVTVTLPKLQWGGVWCLDVDTYGDEEGRFYYEKGKEPRISGNYVMRPRTVAVFSVSTF